MAALQISLFTYNSLRCFDVYYVNIFSTLGHSEDVMVIS